MGTMQSLEFMARDSTAWSTSSLEVMGSDLIMGSVLSPEVIARDRELMLQPVLRSCRVHVAEGRDDNAYIPAAI
jgi:hypothetical protein